MARGGIPKKGEQRITGRKKRQNGYIGSLYVIIPSLEIRDLKTIISSIHNIHRATYLIVSFIVYLPFVEQYLDVFYRIPPRPPTTGFFGARGVLYI